MQQRPLLMIFVKNPEPGKVKTRLARTTGREKALAIYMKLLAYTRKITEALNIDKQVWYSRHIDDSDGWNPELYTKKVQQGNNLGVRMKYAFKEAFRNGYTRVAIIGSDCAELSSVIIQQAFDLLTEQDVVVGPSSDGGYYLLGMNAFHPILFDDIKWSTPAVLPKTLEIIRQKELGLHLLPELNDVDDEADWKEVKDRFK